MSERLFFHRGSFLGSSIASNHRVHGTFAPPRTISLFCPHCNEIWFVGLVTGSKAFCYTRSCEKHVKVDSTFSSPGTLSMPWEPEWNAELTPQCLMLELRSWAGMVEDWNKWANNF